jgi:hypothetical protein
MLKKLLLIGFLSFGYTAADAQCVMCTKTAESLDDKGAKGLNGGIIYLAFMPMTIILIIGYKWYKSNKGA